MIPIADSKQRFRAEIFVNKLADKLKRVMREWEYPLNAINNQKYQYGMVLMCRYFFAADHMGFLIDASFNVTDFLKLYH